MRIAGDAAGVESNSLPPLCASVLQEFKRRHSQSHGAWESGETKDAGLVYPGWSSASGPAV